MQSSDEALGYRILRQVGHGGFAVVYQAYQERLDRQVALKVLSVDRVDQRTMRRFQRELQLTSRLTGHPNVVTVFDTGMTRSGKPYIAMDLFEDGSLRDRLTREGPFPVADVLRIGVKMAGALAAVHAAGVLHGDVKPQNILISRYGEPALADFGIARVVDSAEVSAMGQAFTPLHAAPEILNGRPQSVVSDVYSLGSTLYQLLAGRPAFHNPEDPSIGPLMVRVFNAPPPPINRRDVPLPVASAIFRAMAKQPEERYTDAREFAQALQALQAELGLPVTDMVGGDSIVPKSPGHTVARSRPRNHLIVGMVAAAVAGAGIGVAALVAVGSGNDGAGTRALGRTALTSNSPAPGTREPVSSATPTTGVSRPIDPLVISALRPRRLRVVADDGVAVTLRWSLPVNAREYPLILQQAPGRAKPATPLAKAADSARVTGLDPQKGYCFRVGVVLEINSSSTIAWSSIRCVRGAIARSGAGAGLLAAGDLEGATRASPGPQ
ncbi:MAG TPA: serine/threonine-protein kinase [Thermopolyspora sp.]